jgi:hypothetical protein
MKLKQKCGKTFPTKLSNNSVIFVIEIPNKDNGRIILLGNLLNGGDAVGFKTALPCR